MMDPFTSKSPHIPTRIGCCSTHVSTTTFSDLLGLLGSGAACLAPKDQHCRPFGG